MLRAALPSIICAGALLAFDAWLAATGMRPVDPIDPTELILQSLAQPVSVAKHTVSAAITALLYCGWFLLPALLLLRKRPFNLTNRSWGLWAVLLIVCGLSVWVLRDILAVGHMMPLSLNVVMPQGIGPLTLHDTYILHLPSIPPLRWEFWIVVTGAATFGAIVVAVELLRAVLGTIDSALKDAGNEWIELAFLLLCIVLYLLPPLASGWFDRYTLPAMPILLAALCW